MLSVQEENVVILVRALRVAASDVDGDVMTTASICIMLSLFDKKHMSHVEPGTACHFCKTFLLYMFLELQEQP